jgi:allantoin racemase
MEDSVKTILILNPNSSVTVTEQMESGCAGISLPQNHRLSFNTLTGAPAGIASQRDVEAVAIPTCDHFLAHPADAYVIGCFSDPGIILCREEISAPVVGIGEAAYREASQIGRFGIVSIGSGSISRHARAVDALGLRHCLAGDRPLDLAVLELLESEKALARIIEVGRSLIDLDSAQVLILGCATMGIYRRRIESALAVPVIDPVRAAVLRASTMLTVDYGGQRE